MSKKKTIFLAALYLFAVYVLAFLTGYFSYKVINRAEGKYPVLDQAYDIILQNYYGATPEKRQLEYAMIRGLIQILNDPYTSFWEAPQHELQSNTLEGKFGGIGARIERLSENKVYLFPFPDSPAIQAGVMDGDELIQVDELPITPETTMDQIVSALRGTVDETVSISVLREGENITFTIVRKEFGIPSVTWNLLPSDPNIGIIHANVVAATTAKEIKKAIIDLQSNGATAFMLDLRNNSGGLVDAGLEIVRLFLSEGVIFEQQYKGKDTETFTVTSKGELTDIPLIILINQNTASAAEMVSGALQKAGRAKLIGIPTYGKDSIQLVFELLDGSSVHVTAARWWIPPRDQFNHRIQPDILTTAETANGDGIYSMAVDALKSP